MTQYGHAKGHAKGYLSPQDLGIEQKVYDQLIAVRDFFLTVAPKTIDGIKSPRSAVFDMGVPFAEYTCGTALCIGGYCALQGIKGRLTATIELTEEEIDAIDYFVDDQRYDVLGSLFYPYCVHEADWSKLTAKSAAKAIQNFLLTGDPRWHAIAQAQGLRATNATNKSYSAFGPEDDEEYEVGSGNFEGDI